MAYSETLALDVRCEGNRNPYFVPLARVLIGEARIDQMHTDRPNGLLLAIGCALPGERLIVDFKKRSCKIVHRLDLPENKDLAKKVRATAGSERGGYTKVGKFAEEEDHQFSDDDIPTWLFHIRTLVDAKKLHVVGNTRLPEMTEIRKMGRVLMGDGFGCRPTPESGLKAVNWLEPIVDGKDMALAK